jgi:hypothetical protein
MFFEGLISMAGARLAAARIALITACVLLAGQARAAQVASAPSLEWMAPLADAADWWQSLQTTVTTFLGRATLGAMPQGLTRNAWLYGALAVAAFCFLVLVWFRLRRRRAAVAITDPDPAGTPGDDLAEVYRGYERSDSISRRARRAGATAAVGPLGGGPGIGAAHGTEPIHGWLEAIGDAQRFALSGEEISIGRHSSNLIVLEDPTVHRYHAKLMLNARGQFDLEDLGGANGTLVNGTRCRQKELAEGDVVEFGKVKMRFKGNHTGSVL